MYKVAKNYISKMPKKIKVNLIIKIIIIKLTKMNCKEPERKMPDK